MKSSQKYTPILIDLDIGDQLTSISCGHVIVELIKFIAYQRLQIPYTYQWLKHVINKKKSCEQDGESKDSFQSERHYRAASTALENLDFILKSLLQEINGPSLPEEVCIALGATPVTCKEVYRLLLPKACHKPQCHSNFIASDQKIQRNVFRTLVTSENLSKVFYNTLSPTNMYVFLKKKILDNQDSIVCSDNFQITSGCRIPRNSKIVVVDFKAQNLNNITCCNDFQIFGDIINQKLEQCHIENDDQDCDSNQYSEIESTNEFKWYQSSYVMKGFKDCIVNGSSVVNTWLDS